MHRENDKIVIYLNDYPRNKIQSFAKDWQTNILNVFNKTGEWFQDEYSTSEELINNPKSNKVIEVYEETVARYMNKDNEIVNDVLSFLYNEKR